MRVILPLTLPRAVQLRILEVDPWVTSKILWWLEAARRARDRKDSSRTVRDWLRSYVKKLYMGCYRILISSRFGIEEFVGIDG